MFVRSFTNYKYTHPYQFAIYADFETLNKPIPCLCILCTELYNNAVGLHKKDEIIQKCKIRNHKIYTFSNCIKCTQMFLLIKNKFSRGCKKSNHKIKDLTSNMCEECLNNSETEVNNEITHGVECNNNCNKCKNRDKCSHSSTTNITRLDPIIYCMVIYDKKLDKIHKIEQY